ncbi:MAG: mandelate racemase/muconate lactonizing enzyme family protein [Armatimonadota bacterium]
MKIASVKTHTLAGSLDKPLFFGGGPFGTFYASVVEIRTDDGHVGLGECIARRAPEVTSMIVDAMLAPVVIGRDPRDIEGLWDDMFTQLRRWGHSRGFVLEAISGVDVALHDLLARAAGLPLYKFLGGYGRERVKCYASSVYIAGIKEMTEEAAGQIALGHTAIKVKIGRPASMGGLRADVESVRAIRAAVGPQVEIMLDVNGAYDAATAIRVARRLEPLDIAWLEEPVYPDDVSGYELIRKGAAIPLAAGEAEFGVFGFRDLIERRAVDVLQPDIARVGGFTAARRVAALAHAYNLAYAPHTGFSGGIAHLASLHLAASVPNFMTYEYFYAPNALRDLFTAPFPQPKDGTVPLPTGPGLGLDLDWDLVRRYEVKR